MRFEIREGTTRRTVHMANKRVARVTKLMAVRRVLSGCEIRTPIMTVIEPSLRGLARTRLHPEAPGWNEEWRLVEQVLDTCFAEHVYTMSADLREMPYEGQLLYLHSLHARLCDAVTEEEPT